MLYVKFDDFEDVSVMGNEKDHGMFIPIKDGNVYAECERCGVVERITSPCEFIASTFRSVSYTHLTLPTILRSCRSRWSPYH